MTLIIRSDYHALPMIEQNKIRWLPIEQAVTQDIRPLRIGILNIMPLGEQYEMNLLNPLGLSILQIEPIWIRLESHAYKTWPKGYIDDLYQTYEQATKEAPLDGLIVTGAPVEHLEYEEVQYWNEFSNLISDARINCPSTLGLCWGGFALAYLSGIPKVNFSEKLFGVFELDNLDTSHPITGALDDKFFCPQSRYAGLSDHAREKAQLNGEINLLAYGKESGYTIFESTDHRQLMHIGHPEYNAGRLANEAIRDRYNPSVPAISNFDFNNPMNQWRMHRNTFFQQWIHYCYTSISLKH
jgi:homoserine O-succinyltransferase